MPGQSVSVRGTNDRGTDNRFSSPIEQVLVAHPIWTSDDDIPHALADGLETERRFNTALARNDFELARLMAARLVADWEFLRRAQDRSPRARDGALLVATLARGFADTGSYTVWAPARFPAGAASGYPTRPRDISQIPPFYPLNVRQWLDACDRSQARLVAVEDREPTRPLDPKVLREALDKTAGVLDAMLQKLPIAASSSGNTPILDLARTSLASLTLHDISAQAHVTLTQAVDSPLLAQTEIILFHGAAASVALDRSGEPTTLHGRLRYPILVGEPGHIVKRNVPPPGTYISVQKYGFSTFKIEGHSISKVLFGGVGGFDENFGGGVVDRHELHKTIQEHLDSLGRFAYIAGVSLETAANPVELTSSRIADKLPDIAEKTVPYAVAAIKRIVKAKGLEATLKTVGEQIIEQLIIAYVRKKIRDFIIKKIGTKFIPYANLAFMIYDYATGEEEFRRIRNAVAALLVAIRGRTADEDTIAANVLGEIIAEEVQKEVIKVLLRATNKAAALGRRSAHEKAAATAPKPAVDEPQAPTPVSAPAEPGHARPASAPGHTPGRFTDPQSKTPVSAPAQPTSPVGIQAGGTGVPKTAPAPPRSHDEPARNPWGIEDNATPDRHENEPAVTSSHADEPRHHEPPAPHNENSGAARGTADRGTPPPTADAERAQGTAGHEATSSAARSDGTQDGAIIRTGVDPVGVHSRNPAPITTRRRLHEATPETGTPMGFQTKIGREVATAIGSPGHEVRVTSRNPDVLIGADTDRHRKDVLEIIAEDPNHPMRPIYDQTTATSSSPPTSTGTCNSGRFTHTTGSQAMHEVMGQATPMSSSSRRDTATRNRARAGNGMEASPRTKSTSSAASPSTSSQPGTFTGSAA